MRARRAFPPIELLVFVVGAGSLGAEIAAARLLAPYFGASTIVWANTIATVLVALSVGYWLGGRLADRHPHRQGLCLLVLAAGILLAAVPFAAGPLLRLAASALSSVSAGGFLGSLVGVLALVALPVLLLGAASPWAVRLSLADVEDSGRVTGRLYAIGTVGSLVGTFVSALLLIPLVGTRRTFLAFALALTLVAVLGLRPRFAVAPVIVAGVIALPTGAVKATAAGARVIDEAQTEYQYARVVQEDDGERILELDEGHAIHSDYRPGSWLTGNYWDEFLALPLAARSRPPGRVAILGNAAGTTARAYGHYFPHTAVDGVEIDPALTRIGRRYFDEGGPRLRVFTADARPYLLHTRERYDSIFVDAYRQPYIPFYLTTREFFALARSRLTPGGTVIVNVGHPEGSDALEHVLTATMRTAFARVLRDPVTTTNTLLVGTDAPASAGRLARAARTLSPDLADVALAAAARLAPGLPGGEVYTDDRAPVEWLVDSSLLGYAEGKR